MKKSKPYAELAGKVLALIHLPDDGEYAIGVWGDDYDEVGASPALTEYRFRSQAEAEEAMTAAYSL